VVVSVKGAPKGFGAKPDRYLCNVMFLKPPLTAGSAVKQIETRDGVDRIWAGPGVLYADRLAGRASQSRVTKMIGRPIYQQMTVRNWNTTTRLLDLLES
jgi:uncharacterized protein (DUF1697 family)